MEKKKKILYLAVTGNEGTDNHAYSNFFYALFLYAMRINKDLSDKYDVASFKRHDMVDSDNLQDSVYSCIATYDEFVVLLDQYDEKNGVFNSNVWFELGLISSQNKPILLVANKKNCSPPPFYIQNINILTFENDLISVFNEKKSECNRKANVSDWTKVKNLISSIADNDAISSFTNVIINRLKILANPFNSISSFAKIAELGFESIEDLFSERGILDMLNNKYVKAEFIPGERRAFEELTKAVEDTKETLRTSRFANQSIVAGSRENSDVHNDFMNALCTASKRVDRCDRIICNNDPSKWNDIHNALLYGSKNMRVFVRKSMYNIGFELVVIDKQVAFIHFYQLDKSGDKNSDGSTTHDNKRNIINSTLKIVGYEVCSKLSHIFDRLHHRDFSTICNDPSRTLLGIPQENDIDAFKDRGYFQMKTDPKEDIHNDRTAETTRSREIVSMFFNAFDSWYKEMLTEDKVNMVVGICSLNSQYKDKIKNSIYQYFPECADSKSSYKIDEIIKAIDET